MSRSPGRYLSSGFRPLTDPAAVTPYATGAMPPVPERGRRLMPSWRRRWILRPEPARHPEDAREVAAIKTTLSAATQRIKALQALLSRHIAAISGCPAPSRRGNAALRSPTSADAPEQPVLDVRNQPDSHRRRQLGGYARALSHVGSHAM